MWFEFTANEHQYRTNPDATWIEYHIGNRWIRTKSATVQVFAINYLKSINVL